MMTDLSKDDQNLIQSNALNHSAMTRHSMNSNIHVMPVAYLRYAWQVWHVSRVPLDGGWEGEGHATGQFLLTSVKQSLEHLRMIYSRYPCVTYCLTNRIAAGTLSNPLNLKALDTGHL